MPTYVKIHIYSVPYLAKDGTYVQVCIKKWEDVYSGEIEIHILASNNTTLLCVLLF